MTRSKRLCVCGHPYDFPYHHPDPSPLRDSTCAGCGCRSRRLATEDDDELPGQDVLTR